MTDFLSLDQAVSQHVRDGDSVHVVMGHSRWTALVRELARQHWHRPSELTLVMASLSSLGTLLFRAGCLAKVVTAYSGDSFPTYTPNPIYQHGYRAGGVAVEHWSFLAYVQRLQAAADGLPAAVTGSLRGSSMATNHAYREVDAGTGPIGLLDPLAPDVTFLHAAVADRSGNLAMAPPLLEGVAGAYAAKRGVVATVERVVDDLADWSPYVRVPGHLVRAVVEAPLGAHPGGLWTGPPDRPWLPVPGYAEDIPFWVEAREATRRDDVDDWIRTWCLEVASQDAYLDRLGAERVDDLRRRADPGSWREDAAAVPVDIGRPVSAAERAAVWAADLLAERVTATGADAVLAGAGLANLAAWLGVDRARSAGSEVALTAELGMWDYVPTPADPFIFNFRAFPSASMLTDASHVLGTIIGGPGTRTVGVVGAAQVDRAGNLNSTEIVDGPFLVGSGGANDVVTRAGETIVVTLLRPNRSPESCSYITSPGDRVTAVVTDHGVLRRDGAELVLTSVAPGDGDIAARARAARAACGWDLRVADDLSELPVVTRADVLPLRDHDRHGWFLRD